MNTKDTKTKSRSLINSHVAWSMGAGLIPVPFADFFAVSAVQLNMVRVLCKVYQVDFKETDGKAIISALTGSGLAKLGARAALKFIPGVGTIVGGIAFSILSGASTYAVGEVFFTHFEKGGTFLDFDTAGFQKYYNEKFEKGKHIVEDIKREQEQKEEVVEAAAVVKEDVVVPKDDVVLEDNNDIVKKLKDLNSLRQAGILSDEEFETIKQKLINSLT